MQRQDGVAAGLPKSSWDWHEHIGTIVAGVSIVFVSIKLYSIAGFSTETAYALVQYASPTSVLLGTVVGLLPPLLFLAFSSSLSVALMAFAQDRPVGLSGIATIVVLLFSLLIVSPVVLGCYVGMILVLILLFALVRVVGIRSRQSEPKSYSDTSSGTRRLALRRRKTLRVMGLLFALLGALIAILMAFSNTPWVPTESIETVGSSPFTAYVLSETTDEIVLLQEKSREVERMKVSKVMDRHICRQPSPALFDALFEHPRPLVPVQSANYPLCPGKG